MALTYVTVDVFTDRVFGGNPLAVVFGADGLKTEILQAIATEFNYSETTFVLPPEDPANTAKVRIFTPKSEMPFAGHPNVGTGYVLGGITDLFGKKISDRLVFEEIAGLVAIDLNRSGDHAVEKVAITAPVYPSETRRLEAAAIAFAVRLDPSEIEISPCPPALWHSGPNFAFGLLRDRDALRRAAPDSAFFRESPELAPETGVMVFCLGQGVGSVQKPLEVSARMFAPLDGIDEDPATGSAAVSLAAMLHDRLPGRPTHFTISQGEDMGRPSLIEAVVMPGEKVVISGSCVPVFQGSITAPMT